MSQPKHFDFLIIGAGISGIDAAWHLQQQCAGKSFAVLETQDGFGGTWKTHRYPGIRSDSDLFTFGFGWKPWVGPPIATATEIMKYLDEALDENNIREHIHYQHKVLKATWSGDEKLWTLKVKEAAEDAPRTFTCSFLWMCEGYYRHEEGYMPDYPGVERFGGDLVHLQSWPENLDYKDKKIVVIGSGAMATTLIPAMAHNSAHVTMLQHSPTYFYAPVNRLELSDILREIEVPEETIHDICGRKFLHEQKNIARRSFEKSEALKKELLAGVRAYLGEDYDVEQHFSPDYRPWRQRLAVVPNGDLFLGLRSGKASVVTDEIKAFTESGIRLKSGEELQADIIDSATGFNMNVLVDIEFDIDGEALDFSNRWAHRGILFSGIPNMAWEFGYIRTTWTMRANLICDFVGLLLSHMDERGVEVVTPQLRPEDAYMPQLPFVDPENFNAGYLTRSLHLLPVHADRQPWVFSQDYYTEKDEIAVANLEDDTLIYR